MKKNRRQIFSQLVREIENSHEYSSNLENLLQSERENLKKKLDYGLSELRVTLDTKNRQLEK